MKSDGGPRLNPRWLPACALGLLLLGALLLPQLWDSERAPLATPAPAGKPTAPQRDQASMPAGAAPDNSRSGLPGASPSMEEPTATTSVEAGPLRIEVQLVDPLRGEPVGDAHFRIHGEENTQDVDVNASGRFVLELDPELWSLGRTYRMSASRGLRKRSA